MDTGVRGRPRIRIDMLVKIGLRFDMIPASTSVAVKYIANRRCVKETTETRQTRRVYKTRQVLRAQFPHGATLRHCGTVSLTICVPLAP